MVAASSGRVVGADVGFAGSEHLTRVQHFAAGLVAIPILVLVAASHVYRLLPANSATRKAEREWKRELADVDCTVELTDNGFQYIAGSSTYNATWAEVSSVFQSEHLLIFCDDDIDYALLIPKRSFTSEKQLQQFREIAYQKTVLEKSGEVA